MALTPKGQAPYTSATAAIAALDSSRHRGLGTPITPEILTRAGVPESISRRTLQSLRVLDLIDDDGHPSAQWEDLKGARGDDEYRSRLQAWLRSIYADILQYADPSTDSLDRIVEAFRGYEPEGQRRSMAALMIGLWRYADLPVAAESSPRATTPRSPTRRQSTPKKKAAVHIMRPNSIPDPGFTVDGLPPGLVGLLQQIPQGGKSWTTQRRDAFLTAFRGVLDFSVPVDDNPPPVPSFDASKPEDDA